MNTSCLAVLLLACAPFAVAQTSAPDTQPYPVKPIRIVVGFAAGGPNDTQARIVGQKMSEDFGQPVIVDSRPGADGVIGADMVAQAKLHPETI
jgi:tripartite-type tricarboxylate transporter receptor subunit TctC